MKESVFLFREKMLIQNRYFSSFDIKPVYLYIIFTRVDRKKQVVEVDNKKWK